MEVEWKTTENHKPPERSQWSTMLGPYHAIVTGDPGSYAADLYVTHTKCLSLGRFPARESAQRACVIAARDAAEALAAALLAELHRMVEPSPAPSEDAPAPETFPAT